MFHVCVWFILIWAVINITGKHRISDDTGSSTDLSRLLHASGNDLHARPRNESHVRPGNDLHVRPGRYSHVRPRHDSHVWQSYIKQHLYRTLITGKHCRDVISFRDKLKSTKREFIRSMFISEYKIKNLNDDAMNDLLGKISKKKYFQARHLSYKFKGTMGKLHMDGSTYIRMIWNIEVSFIFHINVTVIQFRMNTGDEELIGIDTYMCSNSDNNVAMFNSLF